MSDSPTYLDATAAWAPYEQVVATWPDLEQAMSVIGERFPDRQFVWRGSSDATWGLTSSLYRRVWWTRIADGILAPPDENVLLKEERKVINEARRWGLHSGSRGLLSGLELLATLQHYGVPTRLIDVTFNAMVAAFFAVEPTYADGKPAAEVDGRLFVIDVTGLLLNDYGKTRRLPESPHLPWREIKEWTTRVRAWMPSGFDRRIAAQHGGFLIGGVAGDAGHLSAWPKVPNNSGVRWRLAERRAATSVALRPHKLDKVAGSKYAQPETGRALFTIRIAKEAKQKFRMILKQRFGFDHATLYADPPGLASTGIFWLRGRPPAAPPPAPPPAPAPALSPPGAPVPS